MLITSVQNREVKMVRELAERKHRDAAQRFAIEGVRLVEAALAAEAKLETVYYAPKLNASDRGDALLREIEAAGVRTVEVTPEVLGRLADTDSPQGIVAVVTYPTEETELPFAADALLVLADGIQDPGNLGTIIRSADAAGADGVLVTAGSADIYHPKTVRATMGSLFHLPVVRVADPAAVITKLQARGFRFLIGDIDTELVHYDADYTGGVILGVGGEAGGASPAVLAAADAVVKIPLLGRAESLNAGVAASILLYEAVRQRRKTISPAT